MGKDSCLDPPDGTLLSDQRLRASNTPFNQWLETVWNSTQVENIYTKGIVTQVNEQAIFVSSHKGFGMKLL